MNRRVVAFLGLLSAVLLLMLVPAIVSAQTVTPPAATAVPAATATPAPTLAAVRAKFGSWTQLDAVAGGYVRTASCYPNAGYYAWNVSLVDAKLDNDNPEGLILDAQGNVAGLVYVTTGTAPATTFGDANARFAATPLISVGLTLPAVTPAPTPAPAVTSVQVLRVWLDPNAAGTFAATNAAVVCPTGPGVTPPPAPTATPRPPVTGDMTLPGGWGLYLAIFGIGALAIGVFVARRNTAKS